ncbi:hypothetical protein DL768_011241 [Monosporascus sp. mg162]|nr:hypothetical protein DL768_011241 [Monosporascus sp. mg162]
MFQSIKGAIDRTIAQEQARQKALADQRGNSSSPSASSDRRSVSVSRTDSATRRRPKKPSQDVANGDTGPNPDPAVFEAAFVIDDDDGDAPKPTPPEKDFKDANDDAPRTSEGDRKEAKVAQNGEKPVQEARSSSGDRPKDVANSAPAELSPQIKAKLRKLEKLESTYPELLRHYRGAHGRAISVEPFERALRENTPLTSIKDPAALVEYLSQLNLKGDMYMEELKRVSAEKDTFKKKAEEAEKELASLKDEVAALRAAKSEQDTAHADTRTDTTAANKEDDGAKPSTSPSGMKSPVSSILGVFSPKQKPVLDDDNNEGSQDMFSYDDEIPQLQAEVASKSEEIAKLQSEMSVLKEELAVAKENSIGLVENLEKATRELSASRDKIAVQESLQTQLDARNIEIKSLTEKLEETQAKLRGLETSLEEERTNAASTTKQCESQFAASNAKNSVLDTELKEVAKARSELEKKVSDLSREIDSLKKSKTEAEEKVGQLTKQIQSAPQPGSSTSQSLDMPPATPATSGSKKKNNKKKKRGSAAAAAATEATLSETSKQAQPPPPEKPDTEALNEEIVKLKDEISQKDTQIERLSKQRKTEEDLRDEIESMQENLINIGQDHVEAKEKIKGLESEKAMLQSRIAELEEEIASFTSNAETSSKLQTDFDCMKAEFDELKIKSQALQLDLGAAQQLAQTRYKDLTELREILAKAQPELKSLRQDSAALKTTKDELAAKQNEVLALEKKEKDLKSEIARSQRLAADREAEVRLLNDRLSAEKTSRARVEDERRVAGRDLRRAEAEKIELSAKAEKAERELQSLRKEINALQPRIKELEASVENLEKEKRLAKEESDLRTQQYNNAQGLLASMRDQTAELNLQLREARSQAEALEEELAESQRHLSERAREGETMRRLLADVDERAEAKVREMRTHLEAAVEERDRAEDEAATAARRRAREAEDLKSKLRELEREVRELARERDDLAAREQEHRRHREELEELQRKADYETGDLQAAVKNLRDALDASEAQVRDAEARNADLKRVLDESRARYEGVRKELRGVQARLTGTTDKTAASGSGSIRSSVESARSGVNGHGGVSGGASGPAVDTLYLKTILLQFLEVKDEKVRSQLVPVLGKLLKFDR